MDRCPDPGTLVSVLQILTAAAQTKGDTGTDTQSRLDQALMLNIDKLEAALKIDDKFEGLTLWWNEESEVIIPAAGDLRWRFVLYCLKSMDLLQKSLMLSVNEYKKTTHDQFHQTGAPKMSPDTLSFSEQKIIKTALQFIICLGICPNLHTGVGLPLELRSEFSELVTFVPNGAIVTDEVRNYHLFLCLKILTTCIYAPSLGTIILTQHLADILAGLLQLIHDSRCDQDQEIIAANNGDSCNNIPNVSYEHMNPATVVNYVRENFVRDSCDTLDNKQENQAPGEISHTRYINIKEKIDIGYCEKVLEDMISKVYPPLLVKTHLLLQGGYRKKNPQTQKTVVQPAPIWLRQECGKQLSNIVTQSKGVQSVLRGMLDIPGNSTGMTKAADWRMCDAVAKVIACCPMQSVSLEEYYRKVAPQILELLHIADKQVAKQFVRVSCSVISNMYAQDADLTRSYLIMPVIQPLYNCLETNDIQDIAGHVVVDERHVSQCIEDCHKVFVCGCLDHPKLIMCLEPVILTIYNLFVFIKPGVSALKSACQEILSTFLKQSEPEVALTLLELMAFCLDTSRSVAKFHRMHESLKFAHGERGGVIVITGHDQSEDELYEKSNVDCVVTLLKDIQNTGLSGEFLVFMLKELTKILHMEVEGDYDKDDRHTSLRQKSEETLLYIEQRQQDKVKNFYQRLALLDVLASVCETLGPSCIKNVKHTLDFVQVTLERGVQICQSTDDVLFAAFENETLTMALGLLTAVLAGAFELSDRDKDHLQELLPLLKDIGTHHPEFSIQEMATDIRIAIATHGVVWSENAKSNSQDFRAISVKIEAEKLKVKTSKTVEQSKCPTKIEVLSNSIHTSLLEKNEKCCSMKTGQQNREHRENGHNNHSDMTEKTGSFIKTGLETVTALHSDESSSLKKDHSDQNVGEQAEKGAVINVDSENSGLNSILKELCDTLIPVRGHGLIQLTRLICKRDPEVYKQQNMILQILTENLDHPDTYIYLSAVNGLAAMCDILPALVVPKICEQFSSFQNHGKKCNNESPELKMKLGEIIMKAARSLGDTIPQYRDVLLKTVLNGVKDSEALVRASSLSNLGEICKYLRFSLGNNVYEIFQCCSSLLKSDRDVHVRKAAGQALTLLLQGLGKDVFKVLESILKDLYKLLKLVMQTEKDDGVKMHVHLALNELDDLMKEQLFPQQKLEKRIRVLDME